MVGRRFTPNEIVRTLREVDALRAAGMTVRDAVREVSVSEVSYRRWRRIYEGMSEAQLRRIKQLERENRLLRKTVAQLQTDNLRIRSEVSALRARQEGGRRS